MWKDPCQKDQGCACCISNRRWIEVFLFFFFQRKQKARKVEDWIMHAQCDGIFSQYRAYRFEGGTSNSSKWMLMKNAKKKKNWYISIADIKWTFDWLKSFMWNSHCEYLIETFTIGIECDFFFMFEWLIRDDDHRLSN